jgi:hypothetical protein
VQPAEKEEEMRALFDSYDANHDGVISVSELVVIAQAWGIELQPELSLMLIRHFNRHCASSSSVASGEGGVAENRQQEEDEKDSVLQFKEYKV